MKVKTYNKLLSALTAFTLATTSYTGAYAITKNNLESSMNIETNYSTFNNKADNIKKEIDKDNFNKPYPYTGFFEIDKFDIDLDEPIRVLLYFANYGIIANTDLEKMLQDNIVIDTYPSTDFYGFDLDYNQAQNLIYLINIYNHNVFDKIECDEEGYIVDRKFDTSNINNLINPSIFMLDSNDENYINSKFNVLKNILVNIDNKDELEKGVKEYFSIPENASKSAIWFNNMTNNVMLSKILETYIYEHYNHDEFDYLLINNNISGEEWFFNGEIKILEEPEFKTKPEVSLDKVKDSFLKEILNTLIYLHSSINVEAKQIIVDNFNENLDSKKMTKVK